MDSYYSRHSNSAGLALPHIPRRVSGTRSPARSPPTAHVHPSGSFEAPVAKVVVQPPTPPDARSNGQSSKKASNSGSSSGSGSDTYVEILAPKARRARSYQRDPVASMCPPEQSTPTPVLRVKAIGEQRVPFPTHGNDQEDTPRPSSEMGRPSNHARSATETSVPRAASVTIDSLGRRSPMPLKSSLKSRRPVVRGDLSVVTGPLPTSKSEPATPSVKSVHFDSNLEQVKLFLAEQKPAAVSRDGSPTDDTSGTESDFPSFIYGEQKKTQLVIDVQGLKEEKPEERDMTEVKLVELKLAEDGLSLTGVVRVKNIAFEKAIVVRFTSDNWQTTSEVSAKYLDSLSGAHDRFQFSIRLNDMMNKIEEKIIFLAVRYNAAGREMWDNNSWQNYRVSFTKKVVESRKQDVGADLKSKLEIVVKNEVKSDGFLGGRPRSVSPVSSPTAVVGKDDDSFSLKSTKSLSSRYDFSASLKTPWRPSDNLPFGDRARTSTYPNLGQLPRRPSPPSFQGKHAFLSLTRSSPRILGEDEIEPPVSISMQPYVSAELDETPIAAGRKSNRNHQRGYFDLGVASSASGVRRTPPGTPLGRPGSLTTAAPRAASTIPVISPSASDMWRVPSGGSEESTPSNTSNEDSSRGSSPSGSPFRSPIALVPEDPFPTSPHPDDTQSYSAFLHRFCFYTGPESTPEPSADIQRSHSVSSVEEFLSGSPSLGSEYFLTATQTPARSSSYDDVAMVSGDSTPKAAGVARSPPVPTPVAFAH